MSENTQFRTALFKAMALCSHREFCCSEIRHKLQSWDVGDNDIEKIICLLIKENFINEKRFAQAFVKDKFNYNKWGKIKIISLLRGKNIPVDTINTALESIDNEIYKKALKDLISGHSRCVKAKNQHEMKAKLLRYGLSKGFESSLLYELLNEPED